MKLPKSDSSEDFVRDVLNLTSDISMSQGGCAIMDVVGCAKQAS